MRVHMLVDYLANAGTERQLLQLAIGLSKAGVHVEYSVLWESGHDTSSLLELARGHGIAVHSPLYRDPTPSRIVPAARLIARRLRERRPDVLHCAMSGSEVVGMLAATIVTPRVSRVVWRRHMSDWRPAGPVKQSVHRLALRKASRIIVNSTSVGESTLESYGLSSEQIRVIPNMVDVERFRPLSVRRARSNVFHIVTVANLGRAKGHEFAIQAAEILHAQGVKYSWEFVGGGDLLPGISERVSASNAPLKVVGPTSDVRPFLQGADLFVHPSLSEGMPNSVLEAMATGLPIVATSAGGTGELLGDGGVLVSPGDASELANAIRILIANESLGRALGERARERAMEFSERRCVDQHIANYRLAIST